MLPVLFLALLSLGCAFGSPYANKYFETVLNMALPTQIWALKLDPATVPDFTTNFEEKVKVFSKVKGKAEYSKGNLTGLANTGRYSECQGPYYNFGTKSLNCTIGFNDLAIKYDGKLKYGNMPEVNIKAHADVTLTLVYLEVVQKPVILQQSLKRFLFQQIGALQIRFTGLGPLNRFTKVLEDGFRAHVQAEVFDSMSQRLEYALGMAVAQVPLPVSGDV